MGVIASAPARIDLAGGTLDIWPIYLLHPGALTVNVAVTIHAEAEVSPRASGVAIVSEDRGLGAEAADAAEVAGCLSLEALNGTTAAFDERIHALRPHPRQIRCAENLRRILAGSRGV